MARHPGPSGAGFHIVHPTTPALTALQNQTGPQLYSHVRSGILPQAETTGGWRIRQTRPLFDEPNKTMGSHAFLTVMRDAVEAYAAELRTQSRRVVAYVTPPLKRPHFQLT